MTGATSRFLLTIVIGASLLFAGDPGSVAARQRSPAARLETRRKQPPKPGPARPLKLPVTREVKLDNGLTVVLVEDHRAPVVTMLAGIRLEIIPSNDKNILTEQIALAEAAAELVTEGAGSRTSEQLAREIETLGGRISSSAHDDYAEVSVTVMAENSSRVIGLLGDVLMRANFPDDEVTLYKRNRIQNLVVQRQDPAILAGEQFDRAVFGSHRYGITSPTPASIEALDRAKIEKFYKSNFAPNTSVVVITGEINAGAMEQKAREVFSKWNASPAKAAAAESLEFPTRSGRQVFLIDRRGSEQADFRVGGLAVNRSHPDYYPLAVVNAILGAGTNSRLFLGIRERKGYAYDVYSSLAALRDAGAFFGGAQSRNEVTVRAISEMLAEFDRLRTLEVGPRELQNAKNYLNGLFSLSLSTQGGVAHRILQRYMLDLDPGHLESYRARIDAVTARQVRQAAAKYLAGDTAAVVVVGDVSKLAAGLKAIGSVRVLDLEGKPAAQPSK